MKLGRVRGRKEFQLVKRDLPCRLYTSIRCAFIQEVNSDLSEALYLGTVAKSVKGEEKQPQIELLTPDPPY